MTFAQEIRSRYFKAQRKLVEAKQLDERSVLLSFPLHYSGYTRVEFAVTRISPIDYVLSDFAQTFGELHDSGYSVNAKLKQRILEIAKRWQIDFSGDNLIRTCSDKELGDAIHEFAEAVKTIGDAYLAYPRTTKKDDEEEDEVKRKIRQTLDEKKIHYGEGRTIPGRIEEHRVDFYAPPNGLPGLALAVLLHPDRVHAEAWGFKAQDIRDAFKAAYDSQILVGLVYNPSLAKEGSRNIIEGMADIPLPSTDLDSLGQKLDALGVAPSSGNGAVSPSVVDGQLLRPHPKG